MNRKSGAASEAVSGSRRLAEADFLAAVGQWFANSPEAKAHAASIAKFLRLKLVTLVDHPATSGFPAHLYELTDAGLLRLSQLTSEETAFRARHQRDYMRQQRSKRQARQKIDPHSTF